MWAQTQALLSRVIIIRIPAWSDLGRFINSLGVGGGYFFSFAPRFKKQTNKLNGHILRVPKRPLWIEVFCSEATPLPTMLCVQPCELMRSAKLPRIAQLALIVDRSLFIVVATAPPSVTGWNNSYTYIYIPYFLHYRAHLKAFNFLKKRQCAL